MGELYRAKDTRLGRDVAIKVLPQRLAADPDGRARCEREAKTISALSHPNVCALFEVGLEGETAYLVMELIDGQSLSDCLTRGPLSLSEVATAVAAAKLVASGLGIALHLIGVHPILAVLTGVYVVAAVLPWAGLLLSV